MTVLFLASGPTFSVFYSVTFRHPPHPTSLRWVLWAGYFCLWGFLESKFHAIPRKASHWNTLSWCSKNVEMKLLLSTASPFWLRWSSCWCCPNDSRELGMAPFVVLEHFPWTFWRLLRTIWECNLQTAVLSWAKHVGYMLSETFHLSQTFASEPKFNLAFFGSVCTTVEASPNCWTSSSA